MGVSKVFVEVNEQGQPIRILRNNLEVWKLSSDVVRQWPKSEAVREIRSQVFARANGECEYCGARITPVTGEMHEKLAKGNGGEVSLENSVALCHGCHTGRKDSEHGNRRFNSSKIGV